MRVQHLVALLGIIAIVVVAAFAVRDQSTSASPLMPARRADPVGLSTPGAVGRVQADSAPTPPMTHPTGSMPAANQARPRDWIQIMRRRFAGRDYSQISEEERWFLRYLQTQDQLDGFRNGPNAHMKETANPLVSAVVASRLDAEGRWRESTVGRLITDPPLKSASSMYLNGRVYSVPRDEFPLFDALAELPALGGAKLEVFETGSYRLRADWVERIDAETVAVLEYMSTRFPSQFLAEEN